jgi:hypothetical protein
MAEKENTTTTALQPETNKRARYTAGMLLNATDLTLDQSYFLSKDYQHNLNLHGYGTVNGLDVTIENDEANDDIIKISAGMGVDRLGRSFTIGDIYCANFTEWLRLQPQAGEGIEAVFVVAYYAEKSEEPRPIAAITQACGETRDDNTDSRIVDSFCLKLVTTRPPMPLWEATRIFYNDMDAGADLDEAYRQWVREELPRLHTEEAETLNQPDGAAILLGKVVLKRQDEYDKRGDSPYIDEDHRPYLLPTQLLQGLRGGNAAEVEYAKRADHALKADYALTATRADMAVYAIEAERARQADEAINAEHAKMADLSAFATHTSRIVPFVTITPGTYDPGTSSVTQSFEFWFHLDVVLTENVAFSSETELPEIDKPVPVIAYSEVNGGGLNPADIVAIGNRRLTPVSKFANVYRAMLRFREGLETPPPFLRFVFDLTKVRVSNNQGQEQPILTYMSVNALNFEGFWSDPPGAPVDDQAGAVIVYVRNTGAVDVNDLSSLSAPLRDQIVAPPAPAKPATPRKRRAAKK